jgi:hypothetical protein
MKNKIGGLTTHWGGWPPTKEVGGGATTPEPFGVAVAPSSYVVVGHPFFFFEYEFDIYIYIYKFFVILIQFQFLNVCCYQTKKYECIFYFTLFYFQL